MFRCTLKTLIGKELKMEKRRVVITGIGMVTPLGNSVQETWHKLINGESGIGELTRFDPADYKAGDDFPRIAGEVRDFNLEKWGINRKIIKHLDRFAQYALAASVEAIYDAEINFEKENLYRIGIQMGCGFFGVQTWEKQYQNLIDKGVGRVSAFFIPMTISNMAAGNLGIIFRVKGPNISINTACASGSHAIGEAFDKIRWGRVDIMITGGTEAALTPLTFSGFNNIRALSRRNENPEKASRPFDKDRDGFVMAEGAGVVILEELSHALKRNAKIYGELIGFGMNSDAFHITEPSSEGPRECMRSAIREGGVKPEEIEYINAHGTATLIGDISETKAIKELFGAHAYNLCVSSTKSMTGHLLGATGGIEAIVTILVLKEGIIPPTINLENPAPECDLDYIPNVAREVDVRIALSNSFGFGGTNACLLFKQFRK